MSKVETSPTQFRDPVPRILELLSGKNIEARLLELAAVGGIEQEEGRYAVNRLALSSEDFQARAMLSGWMREDGMDVEEHPLGLIGRYKGQETDLPSIVLMSHFDSVPNGGMYDGTVGVISAIELIRVINELGIKPRRSIMVLALTGEESSRFNLALFGSHGMFQGLTEADLCSGRPEDYTLAEALEANGFKTDSVRKPRFRASDFYAAIELHVSQNNRLDGNGSDLAIIEAIAAPERYQIVIGDQLEVESSSVDSPTYFTLGIKGKAEHSGATPMGREFRADGLLAASDDLIYISYLSERYPAVQISIGGVNIEGQALNKIPGNTSMLLRVSSASVQEKNLVIQDLERYIARRNKHYLKEPTQFHQAPIQLEQINNPEVERLFYDSREVLQRHKLAGQTIKFVNQVCNQYRLDNIVGTVGTYILIDGQIILGLDIRGVNSGARAKVVGEIMQKINNHALRQNIKCEIRQLGGNSSPTDMDERLVALAAKTVEEYGLGKYNITYSPAGHDIQTATRIGIPALLLFIPSRGKGISHSPEEYSTPLDLENGVKTLASIVIKLASE